MRQLSGGMKRRLMVAKAMVHNPPVLILDEPTAGVDVELRRQLWDYVVGLNRQGVTIVLTTHYLEEAEELCDTIAIVNRGEVVACEPTAKLLRRLDTRAVVITPGRAARPRPPALPPFETRLRPTGELAVSFQHPRGQRRSRCWPPARDAGVHIKDLRTEEPGPGGRVPGADLRRRRGRHRRAVSGAAPAIEQVAASILGLRRERPLRVLIDGRSAAGKTTFAATLGERLAASGREVLTAHFDDFHPAGYRPQGSSAYSPERYLDEGFDFGAFERFVIAPTALAGSRHVVSALPGASDAGSGEMLIADDGILLVEGAFLLKPALRVWWDFTIWLDVSFATMVERAVARDVAWVGDADKVRARYQGFWTDTHSLYEACGAQGAAHAVIDNEAPANPRLVRFTPPPS